MIHNFKSASFTFAILFLLNASVYSESTLPKKKKRNSNIARIEGKVKPGTQDTILLFLQKKLIYGEIGREIYQTICDSDGSFQFSFDISQPAKISMFLNGDSKVLLNNFYVLPKDVISILVLKDEETKIVFSGKGVEKFQCMYQLDSTRRNTKITRHSIPDSLKISGTTLMENLLISFKRMDHYSTRFLDLLDEYEGKIDKGIFELLLSDVVGDVASSKCFLISEYLEKASLAEQEQIKQLFLQSMYNSKERIRNNMAVYSENYIKFLILRSQLKLKMGNFSGIYSMEEMTDLIEKNFNQLIRESLLVYYIMSPKAGVDNSEYEKCIKRSISIIHDPFYKQFLHEQLYKISKGSEAYDFFLPDSSGKYVSLSDFKGKVVLIDFWFTGCSACISLSKELEEKLIPFFNESKVVFISISLDKEKSKWIKSIDQGLYTSPSSINLFTEGKGFSHPLISHYNIQGCPTLLLIDKKGLIATATPNRNAEILFKEINSILEKNSRPD